MTFQYYLNQYLELIFQNIKLTLGWEGNIKIDLK
jgi:hypothetical protein